MQFLTHKEKSPFFASRRLKLFLKVFLAAAVLAALFFFLAPKARELLNPAGNGTNGSVHAAAAEVFRDVPAMDENAAAIAALNAKGMIKGFGDGTFHPQDPIRREEFVKLVVSARGADPHPVSNSRCFTDVGVEWFAKYVCYAKRMGWVQGYDGDRFGSGEDIAGLEALALINKSFGVKIADDVIASEGDLLRGQAAGLVLRALESSRSAPAL